MLKRTPPVACLLQAAYALLPEHRRLPTLRPFLHHHYVPAGGKRTPLPLQLTLPYRPNALLYALTKTIVDGYLPGVFEWRS